VAREGFLKDKCGPRARKFEQHWFSRRCLIKTTTAQMFRMPINDHTTCYSACCLSTQCREQIYFESKYL